MRKSVKLLVVLFVLVVALPALGQEEPPMLARGYALKVKPGHEAQFEAAMKKQVEWYKANNETWHWHVWQWETGEDMGEYVFRSPGHYWKDMDDRAERTSRARAHFQSTVSPHTESMRASISEVLPKISRWPTDMGEVPMVSVYEFNVHYGMAEDFVNTIGKIHEAIEESGWPVHYAWLATVSGGEVPTFSLVIPRKSWADMKGPEKPFWPMMEEAVGRAEADAVKASLMECVREQHSALARFRPDLSYIPAQ